MSTTTRSSAYSLASNQQSNEAQRLKLLENVFDAPTTSVLRRVGVCQGWRCLEVGAGAGSIAWWLADRVGPTGTVVATDIDTHLMQGVARPNLEVVQHDIVQDGPVGSRFDLIHARAVLEHLPSRDALLARMANLLAPGGVLVVDDFALFPVLAAQSVPYRKAWQAFAGALAKSGTDYEWAAGFPNPLASAGLQDCGAAVSLEIAQGGSPLATLVHLTLDLARDRILDGSFLTANEFDAGVAPLHDQRHWVPMPALVSAWGRRPAM